MAKSQVPKTYRRDVLHVGFERKASQHRARGCHVLHLSCGHEKRLQVTYNAPKHTLCRDCWMADKALNPCHLNTSEPIASEITLKKHFSNIIQEMRKQRYEFEAQIRVEQKRRQVALAEVVAFGIELKAQSEIEDVIFPGDDLETPECILILRDGIGLVRVMYLPETPGQIEYPESFRVDVSPLPAMSFDVEVFKVFPAQVDIMGYVAKCVAVLQAYGNRERSTKRC